MLCFRYKKLLVPYAEGTLDEQTHERMRMHIERCKRCAAELHTIESMSKALCQAAPQVEPAEDLWTKVSARIADENTAPARRVWMPKTAAAGLIAVLIVVGYAIMRPDVDVTQVAESKHTRMSKGISVQPATPQKPALVAQADRPLTGKSLEKTKQERPVLMAKLPDNEATMRIGESANVKQKCDQVKPSDFPVSTNSDSPARDAVAADTSSKSLISGRLSSQKGGAPESISSETSIGKDRSNHAGVDLACSDTRPAALAFDTTATALGKTSSAPVKMESERSQLSVYKRIQDFKGVVQTASELIRTDPANAPYYYTDLGMAYAGLERAADARKMYRCALDYGNSETWPVTAVSMRDSDLLPCLYAEYSRKFSDKNDSRIGCIVFEVQVAADDRCGMLDTALKLLKIEPNNPDYLMKLGEAYERLGNKQKARAAYEKLASGSDSKYASIAKGKIAAMEK